MSIVREHSVLLLGVTEHKLGEQRQKMIFVGTLCGIPQAAAVVFHYDKLHGIKTATVAPHTDFRS